ncbi:hypothetical protein [Sphingomonas sp. LT1P40]|uniref:hypothetical protein n=1 Tax=Alteristakelama amylovorans TaxID=3096166 RepID=UPI002FCB5EE4
MKIEAGDRVQIADTFHWACGATGTVKPYPASIADEMTGDLTNPVIMLVPTMKSTKEQAWIVFDEPQIDGDGDGPYRAGMIDVAALTKSLD